MSIQARLVLVTVAIVAVALVAADVGAYLGVRSLLVSRGEQDLLDAMNHATKALVLPTIEEASAELGNAAPGLAFATYDATGRPVATRPASAIDKTMLPAPLLPDPTTLPVLNGDERQLVRTGGGPVTVPAASGGFDYVAIAFGRKDGGLVVGALPLRDAATVLAQLAVVEVVVTVAVLGAVALVSRRAVAIGLQPLSDIERTADRIAAGEIGRRIERADQGTEVGRLAIALNTMLERIEAALTAREASEQRLRRLVTDASHELRTPLTSLRGYAELFRRGASERPADLSRAMRGIELEAERMAVLVDDLLLLARLDEGQALPAADEDLVPIVRAAVEAARVVEPDRRIDLDVPTHGFVHADATRLRQVIDNLLANVRVHTPRGAPAAVSVQVDGERVILEVADTGPGMSEAATERAFERFFRADPSRSRDSGGSGLGLAIVAGIVRAYGGDVAVESRAGHGTRFAVRWPAAGSSEAAALS
jgi:two-component system, OmpR family, sensor kinase